MPRRPLASRGPLAALAALVFAVLAAVALAPASDAAPAERGKSRIVRGSVPDFARSAKPVGPARGRVDFALVLPLRDQAGLAAFNDSVSDPSSAEYANYLSPAEFRRRYAPAGEDVDAANAWLRDAGFRLTDTNDSGTLIGAAGGVAKVERAFGTELENFRTDGETLRAPADEVRLPTALDGVAVNVTGLEEAGAEPANVGNPVLTRKPAGRPPNTGDDPAPPAPLFRNAGPCSRYWAERTAYEAPKAYGDVQPYAPCGLKPDQIQGAYGVTDAVASGDDGSGEVVTIIDAFNSPTIERDVQRYAADAGQPPVDLRQTAFTGCKLGCKDANKQGWYGEQTLDIEAVHAIAPGAPIQYVGGFDNYTGLDFALSYVLDNADQIGTSIVSNSYGYLTERIASGKVRAQQQLHAQAVAEGVGLYFSSGDDGDNKAVVGYQTASYPASSPDVTAVGGTSLAVGPLDENRFETGWGTFLATQQGKRWAPKLPGEFLYGAGGGTSRLFGQPDYQAGIVPDSLARRYGGLGRVVPDIAAVGDPNTGMLVGQTQTAPNRKRLYSTYRIGGTSLASPVYAGFMAIADQRAGFDHGFANPAFYAVQDSFRDVTPVRRAVAMVRRDFVNGVNDRQGFSVSLRTTDMDSSLKTRTGYDEVTGLGTPVGEQTLDALAGPN